MEILGQAIKRVSHELSGREIVTVEEIRRVTYTIMLEFHTHGSGIDYEMIVDGVIESMCDEPATINSLNFSERLELDDIEFRHTHSCTPTKELVGEAYREYLKSKRLFDSLDRMREITDTFFAGYSIEDGLVRIYTKKKFRYGIFYSIIDDVERFISIHESFSRSFDGEYVVVALTEKELSPFLRFFRRNSERVKDAGFKIWVANVDQMSIDPFIGYPRDFTLLKGFRNPKVASQINSLWRDKVDQID